MVDGTPLSSKVHRLIQLLRIAFWLACGLVALLSLTPTTYLPGNLFDWWDKAQHAAAFTGLCLLGCFAYPARRRAVVFGLMAFGAGIELAQAATGWRYGEFGDLLADMVGIGLGLAIHRLAGTRLRETLG